MSETFSGEIKPDPTELVLQHYGVKGMRWGVRRSEKQLAKERSSKSSSKITKRKVAAVGAGALAVAGASAAGYALGNAVGRKLGDMKLARTIELGQATIDKGLFDMARTYDMGSMDAKMASYIVKDTFRNRV